MKIYKENKQNSNKNVTLKTQITLSPERHIIASRSGLFLGSRQIEKMQTLKRDLKGEGWKKREKLYCSKIRKDADDSRLKM